MRGQATEPCHIADFASNAGVVGGVTGVGSGRDFRRYRYTSSYGDRKQSTRYYVLQCGGFPVSSKVNYYRTGCSP